MPMHRWQTLDLEAHQLQPYVSDSILSELWTDMMHVGCGLVEFRDLSGFSTIIFDRGTAERKARGLKERPRKFLSDK